MGVWGYPPGVWVCPQSIASVYIPNLIPRIYFSKFHLVQFAFPDLLTLENKAKTDVDPTKKNVIMDQLELYINDLANATDQVAMDAAIRNYLTFYSKFHNYSLTNSLLIFLQKKASLMILKSEANLPKKF